MNWLNEILKNTENNEVLAKLIEDGIKEEFVPKIEYEVLKHENNVLNNMVNDYKDCIENDEYFEKYNEISRRFDEETARLNGIIDENRKNYMVEREIAKAGGRNAKAIIALLDMDNIFVDENGKLVGLEIEKLMESDPYLFEIKEKKFEGTGNRKADKPIKREDMFVASARRAAGLKD